VPEIVVEFGSSQSIGALREAAYRIITEASCLIDVIGDRHACRLIPKKALATEADEEAIRTRFLDLVTDENLREKVAAETGGIRDVIIALAFGALARERDGEGPTSD
jgi:His-Xaa-Ser system protein HxsD